MIKRTVIKPFKIQGFNFLRELDLEIVVAISKNSPNSVAHAADSIFVDIFKDYWLFGRCSVGFYLLHRRQL